LYITLRLHFSMNTVKVVIRACSEIDARSPVQAATYQPGMDGSVSDVMSSKLALPFSAEVSHGKYCFVTIKSKDVIVVYTEISLIR